MAKRAVSAAAELPLLEPTWAPAKTGFRPALRNTGFPLLVALSAASAWQPLATVVGRSLNSPEYEHYSHIILLPFISAYLLYLNRDAIFEHARSGLRAGVALTALGATILWLGGTTVVVGEPEYRLSLAMLGLVTLWKAGFVLSYGVRALRTAAFPFLLLLFMVPLPPAALTGVIRFLQKGSADVSELLFVSIGMPIFRDGFFFTLPGLTIQVAEECSGIRSSLALLLSGLVMAHLFLRSTWARVAFVLVIIPLAIFKNAVRIVALSWLAVHVDPAFITASVVHRKSGIPVFLTSFAILAGLAWLLRTRERKAAAR
jgi:exosortase